MVANAAVKNLIRENNLQQLRSAIETGAQDGMHSMNVSLLKLVSEGRLTTEKAVGASNDIKGIMRDLGNQPRGGRRRR
jgi:twitching motility protein PilT